MSKHTPGPWHYFETADGRCRVKPLNAKYIVAECSAMDPHCDEQRANARLMAAAPDLLSVCKELADSAAYWSEYDVPLGIVERLNAAIAKAEGSA